VPSCPNAIVSPRWLADHLGEPSLRVLDVRWRLDDPLAGRRSYEAGHIPTAHFVDLEEITGREGGGRHPLPTPSLFQVAMRSSGVDPGSLVIAYDDAGGSIAARLWWLLRLHGHENVAVLDGGIAAWKGSLEAGWPPAPRHGSFVAETPDAAATVDRLAVQKNCYLLLDARAPERYSGASGSVDPVGGHIPGARNAFWGENLGPDGKFLRPADLRRRYEELGVTTGETVVYCGSGVTACHDILAIHLAGLGPAKLYPGSWSDWCRHRDAAITTGSQP
jgi:thiosulfate/3-mercaptopyruvate sulfurtransferase